ncbi:MAG: hypothetical protein GF315_09615 [candidate division Zixibacteria bacterium]|nr:hypothetical protein [candidate division Zixibacteria bacterium]
MSILNKWYIKVSIALVILFFLAKSLVENIDLVKDYEWDFKFGFVLMSILLVLFNFMFLSNLWRLTVKYFSHVNLPFSKSYRIWVLSSLGKYVPGKIWAVAGMIYMVEKEGVPRSAAIVSSLFYQYLNIVAGFIFVAFGAFIYFEQWLRPEFFLIGIPIILLSIYPPFASRLIGIALGLLKIKGEFSSIKYRKSMLILLGHLVSWLLYGIAFFIFVNSILDFPTSQFIPLTAVFAGSYIIGFLSFFVPGGLGVREGVMSGSLGLLLPSSIAVTVSLFSRLWLSIAEVFMYISIPLLKVLIRINDDHTVSKV